jgi:predicted peptidase
MTLSVSGLDIRFQPHQAWKLADPPMDAFADHGTLDSSRNKIKIKAMMEVVLMMKRLLFSALLLGCTALAREPAKDAVPGVWNQRVLVDARGKLSAGLPYRLYVPSGYDGTGQYPLVVYLHGAGERGTDNEKHIAKNGAPRLGNELQALTPCFVMAPQCPTDSRWVEVEWGDKEPHKMPQQPSEPMRLLLQLLDELPQEFSLDTRRIYLTGISMGAFGTWDLLVRRPKLFAAAIPVCGGADDSTAPQIKGIPVWTFHGDADGVINIGRTRGMVEAMKAAGAAIQYTEYPGVAHNSWDKAYAETGLFEWMLARQQP